MSQGLIVRDLSVRYGTKTVLDGVNLSLLPGEIVGIVGASGSGKSTLLQAIDGLLGADAALAGDVFMDGVCLSTLPERKRRAWRGGQIGMVFQDSETALCPVVRVRRHAYDVLRTQGRQSRKTADETILALFDKLGLPNGARLLQSYPFELSGGMRQRVALALSMLHHPPILLADEPTAALDALTRLQVLETLRSLRDRFGTAILMTTHQMQALRLLADKIGVLHNGALVEYGPARQILQSPAHPATRALLAAVPRLRTQTEDANVTFDRP